MPLIGIAAVVVGALGLLVLVAAGSMSRAIGQMTGVTGLDSRYVRLVGAIVLIFAVIFGVTSVVTTAP